MKLKTLTKQTRKVTTINEWLQPVGYKLHVCCLSSEMFGQSLNLVIAEEDEFKRWMRDEFKEEVKNRNYEALFYQFEDKEKHCQTNMMNLKKVDFYARDYGVLCHELHHFAHFALDEMGVTYGMGGEEVYAYMQGYFMELCVLAFNEYRKIKKK